MCSEHHRDSAGTTANFLACYSQESREKRNGQGIDWKREERRVCLNDINSDLLKNMWDATNPAKVRPFPLAPEP
jgi:hypothetical protein